MIKTLEIYQAFDFLDFLPGSYQDLARSWKIIREIQDFYQEIQESRRPTMKSRDIFPEFVGFFRMYSQIFQDFSGLLLKVLKLLFPWFCRKSQDPGRDFPGFSRIIQDLSGLLLKVLNLQFPDFVGNFRMKSEIFQDHSGYLRIASWSPEFAKIYLTYPLEADKFRFKGIFIEIYTSFNMILCRICRSMLI